MVRRTTVAFVVVAGAGLAVVAVPQFTRPRCVISNDQSAWSTLFSLEVSERQFQAAVQIDVDHDGIGEFGGFGELSGARALPGGTAPTSPPVVSGVFRNIDVDGTVRRSGYLFRLFLPDSRGDGVSEIGHLPGPPLVQSPTGVRDCCGSGRPPQPTLAARSAPSDRVDPKLASRKWCAYAWPRNYGSSGTETYFVNQDGVVFRTDAPHYSGENGPDPGAAFVDGGRCCITGATRPGVLAQDGQVWTSAP